MDGKTDLSEVSPVVGELQDFHLVTLVDPNAFSDDTINTLWNLVKTQEYAFDDLSRDNPTAFCLTLLQQQCAHFFIGAPTSPSGWCMITGLYEQSNPQIHYLLWDKKFSSLQAKAAAKEILEWVFKTFHCNRVTAFIPEYNEDAKRLSILLRFNYEGQMRESIKFHGKWRAVNIFGLMAKEFFLKVV